MIIVSISSLRSTSDRKRSKALESSTNPGGTGIPACVSSPNEAPLPPAMATSPLLSLVNGRTISMQASMWRYGNLVNLTLRGIKWWILETSFELGRLCPAALTVLLRFAQSLLVARVFGFVFTSRNYICRFPHRNAQLHGAACDGAAIGDDGPSTGI